VLFRSGQGVMRMRANKLMSHVPLDTVQVISPSDRRIKRDIQDIDQEALMHRLMRLRVRRYKYSDEWREVRGLASDTSVRGVIAQEVREVMPEYVTVTDEMRFDEKGFNMTDFHEVDKVALVIDLLAALQARHRRLSVGANAATASGSVSISTMVATEASTRSGHVSVTSGRATRGGSGSVSLRTGGATSGGGSGDISLAAGTSGGGGVGGGAVHVDGGNSTADGGVGGAVRIISGASMSESHASGAVVLSSSSSSNSSGSVTVSGGLSGDSAIAGGSVNVLGGASSSVDAYSSSGGDVIVAGGHLKIGRASCRERV